MIRKTLPESLDHSYLCFTHYVFFHTSCLDWMSPPVVGDLTSLPVRSSNVVFHARLDQMPQPAVVELASPPVKYSNIFLHTIKGVLFDSDVSRDNASRSAGVGY